MEAAVAHRRLGDQHGLGALGRCRGQEKHAYRNRPMAVEAGIQSRGFASEKGGRQLAHDAGAVTARTVSIDGSTVSEGRQTFQSLLNNAVRRRLTDLSHKANAARIVLLALVKPRTMNLVFVRHLIRPLRTTPLYYEA